MEVDEVVTTSSSRSLSTRMIPWVEKYRPEKVSDVSSQEEVISSLQKGISSGQIPHLLFYGPPGTGKTTTMLALARSLYGPELYKSRILELNASDDRGISVVREKIKTFASSAVGTQKTPGYPCPRYKFIILDEADTMTPDAQSALRRVMEQYSKVTRFCLICNYVTRLIEPLASRCSKFRFKSLTHETMIHRLTTIASTEKVKLDPNALDAIMTASGGDMRKAVNYLQSSHQLSSPNNGIVTADAVVEMSGAVPSNTMNVYISAIVSKKFDDALKAAEDILNEGYSLGQILSQLHDHVVSQEENSLNKRMNLHEADVSLICEKIAAVEQNLIDGASEYLQIMDITAYITRKLSEFKTLWTWDMQPLNH